MIKDRSTLIEIRKSWKGVVSLRNNTRTSIAAAATSGVGLGACVISIADAAHNLPFIHACSVLNDSLLQVCKEGHFKCKSIFLGALGLTRDSHLLMTGDSSQKSVTVPNKNENKIVIIIGLVPIIVLN